MGFVETLARALTFWVQENAQDLLSAIVIPQTTRVAQAMLGPLPSRWATANLWAEKTVDGAFIGGIVPPKAGAKYAIPKGLPKQGERTLAIENEPHEVDGFSGVIEAGYGKGTKTLLADEIVAVKVGPRTFLSRMNYHFHEADVAGPHYDIAIEDLAPGTRQFEVHIPRGDYKGRWSFVTTTKGVIVTPMLDRGQVIEKPLSRLTKVDLLAKVKADPSRYIVERKIDGSLGNASINGMRAAFRSHRESGQTYYDRIPSVELLYNRSRVWSSRKLFPGPKFDGTVFQGEIVHADGAPRVSGILNALPVKAQQIQQLRGKVEYHVWDVVKYRGRDVSHLPYRQRRALYEQAVRQIRLFNKQWHAIERMPEWVPPELFYQHAVLDDPRGLPWSEGIVVKDAMAPVSQGFWKIKASDNFDLKVVEFIEGHGKYEGSLGAIVVEAENGARGEVGSFKISDAQRDWIWDHRASLVDQVAEIEAMSLTARGVPRAGRFERFHPSKSDAGLLMYAESLAGGDQEEALRTKYALISAAGWKR